MGRLGRRYPATVCSPMTAVLPHYGLKSKDFSSSHTTMHLSISSTPADQVAASRHGDPGRIAEIAKFVREWRCGHLSLRAPLLAKAESGRRHRRLSRTCWVESIGRPQRENAASDEQQAENARRGATLAEEK